jgi:hypothetical protein
MKKNKQFPCEGKCYDKILAPFFKRKHLVNSTKNPTKMKAFILVGDGLFA